jgi:hypothetical protein
MLQKKGSADNLSPERREIGPFLKYYGESFELLLKFGKSSFLRIPDQGPGQAQESSPFKTFWIPAGVYPCESGGGNDKIKTFFKALMEFMTILMLS